MVGGEIILFGLALLFPVMSEGSQGLAVYLLVLFALPYLLSVALFVLVWPVMALRARLLGLPTKIEPNR